MTETIDDINKSALQFTLSYIPKVKELSNPLGEYLGIKYFDYSRVYNDCRHLILRNGFEEYAKVWISNVKKDDPQFIQSLKDTPMGGPYFYLWPIKYDVLPPIVSLHNLYNIWYGFEVKYRHEDYCEVFSFAFDKQANDKSEFYWTNLNLLAKFTAYFRNQVSDIIARDDLTKLAVFPEKFDFSYSGEENCIEDFLSEIDKNTKLVGIHGNLVSPTKRELECLRILANNKTVKEVAYSLKLSPRTVDFYLNNLKNKLGVEYNNILIDMFNDSYNLKL